MTARVKKELIIQRLVREILKMKEQRKYENGVEWREEKSEVEPCSGGNALHIRIN